MEFCQRHNPVLSIGLMALSMMPAVGRKVDKLSGLTHNSTACRGMDGCGNEFDSRLLGRAECRNFCVTRRRAAASAFPVVSPNLRFSSY
ncbi:hypothetical protein TgHK011_007387 [Trichoderma gracile]|nr:hypothetical protein TgHK011_007387 [Trichoderma gracile]